MTRGKGSGGKGSPAAQKLGACMSCHSASGAGQIVLVFQGGGALGSYQAGVYQALHEADIEPDWIIGTSIGAINASLIAGNRRDDRIPKLKEFWERIESHLGWNFSGVSTGFSGALSN